AEDLHVTLTDKPKPKPSYDNLPFGANTSDHMLEIDYTPALGWSRPHIRPVQPLQIHPAAKVLHYASELFEGMKCYRCVDNKIRMFRPMENMARMERSAIRAGLPHFDQVELTKLIKKLINIDQEWVPYSDKCSLYIRPTYIATEPSLGVTQSTDAKLFVITGPTGPYFPTGMKAIKLLADPQYVRAWPGGCGAFKMGSNYAPTVAVQAFAQKEHNCQQVLWLYGDDHQMTEIGTMNLFVYWINEQGEEELVTPPLDSGLILPGVTRKSLLEVARQWNEFKVSEDVITMGSFIKALNEGRVKEVFGAGTASIVCPVGTIVYMGQELTITDSEHVGQLTNRFYKTINDIHFYRTPHAWMESIDLEGDESLRTATVN
ncbi:branched-chain-amino-acid aminotransferase, partial [Elysia marginata]